MPESNLELFDGPGAMRSLCRGTDWAATPLGPVQSWPPVLRSTVQLCLDSGFPILLNWGPELVALYNDAFAPLIGGKHPEAVGRSAKDLWPEAWEIVGNRLDEVLVHGRTLQFTDERQILERNGYPEECYFTFSHSPIRDENGAIVGLFTASTETTRHILNERRMRVVREVASVSSTASLPDTCQAVLDVLAHTRESLPFAVAFLAGADDFTVDQVAAYGLAADPTTAAVPDLSACLGDPGLIDRVIRTARAEVVTGLRDRLADTFEPGPLGPLTPEQAVVMPLLVSGRSDPIGALVLGVNPYRPLDEELRAFHTVLGRQIRTTLTDAIAFETERDRVRVLADLDHAKMEFFQNVSHELRTPLTLLLAPLQDLLDAPPDRSPDGARQDLEAALRAAQRLHRLVDALLDFSGAEAGTVAPDLRPTDLAALTEDIASMFRAAADHAGLTLVVDVPEEPLTTSVDRGMWSTIVTNLLSNAVKYTERGRITVDLRGYDANVVLTVTDTGVGIASAQQTRVFDRFYRAPTDSPEGGAGIGLTLVADLVHAHQGRIDVTSSPGRGSTFTVTVPAQPVGRDEGSQLVSPAAIDSPSDVRQGGRPAGRTDGTGQPQVLLVEDDSDLRSYLTRLLTGDSWAVTAVAEAETALALVAESSGPDWDVVITDVMLPGHDGLVLAQRLRQASRTSRVPIIMLTARDGADAAALGLAAGADDYITKPFAVTELLARLRANHELHQLREQAVDDAQDRATQLRNALESNRIIGTATGILMAAHRLDGAQAFRLLVSGSQHSNRKLRDIASVVTSTGALPLRQTLIDALVIKAQ
jgi:signal transduction histidine kinase/DNA-binding response OmpR family regulator